MRSITPLLALCLALALLSGCRDIPALPEIAAVPGFELHDHRGAKVTPAELQGKVWIANFMFTSCPDVCPLLTAKMGNVRSDLRAQRPSLRFVSFSVDPETDTPEVLAKYAKEQGADHEGWFFLTGELERVKGVVVKGFKQSMEKMPLEQGKPQNIMHGSHFVLVDQKLQIRGYYTSDAPGLKALARDARRLVAGKADG
ncbi:MAG: SCO family protein [Myxococcales bacterium]|nr:SCO family protein [Myxococcales bacterium]